MTRNHVGVAMDRSRVFDERRNQQGTVLHEAEHGFLDVETKSQLKSEVNDRTARRARPLAEVVLGVSAAAAHWAGLVGLAAQRADSLAGSSASSSASSSAGSSANSGKTTGLPPVFVHRAHCQAPAECATRLTPTARLSRSWPRPLAIAAASAAAVLTGSASWNCGCDSDPPILSATGTGAAGTTLPAVRAEMTAG